MPESDVWLQSVKAGVSSRLGYVAALGLMIGPALRKTTALALTVTTFNMAAYWFKTSWLPTYLIGSGLLPGPPETVPASHQGSSKSLNVSATLPVFAITIS